jgi:hypothetical protein
LLEKKKGKVDSAGSDLAKMQIICKGVSFLKFCAAQAGGRVQCYAHTRGVLCTLFANFLPPQEKKKRQKNFAKGYILRARLSHTAVHISGKGFFFLCGGYKPRKNWLTHLHGNSISPVEGSAEYFFSRKK